MVYQGRKLALVGCCVCCRGVLCLRAVLSTLYVAKWLLKGIVRTLRGDFVVVGPLCGASRFACCTRQSSVPCR